MKQQNKESLRNALKQMEGILGRMENKQFAIDLSHPAELVRVKFGDEEAVVRVSQTDMHSGGKLVITLEGCVDRR